MSDVFYAYANDTDDCVQRPEAAIALRQRLNETVDELDKLNKELSELHVKFDSQSKELTIAKSDRAYRSHSLRCITDLYL